MTLLLSNGRKQRRNEKKEKEIMFCDRSYGWDDIQFGHKGKSQKAVDTTGNRILSFVNLTNSLGGIQ